VNNNMKFSTIKRHLLVIVLFVVITVVMTYPWAGHLNNWVHDGADSYFIAWTLAWDVHAFQEGFSNIFDANIFYPHENTLAYSEHLIGTAILAWPIIALTNNPILAYNLVMFLFFVLGAYCMYLFMYYLTRNSAVSIISAIIFGFNPFRVIHFSQIHLQVIFFFPLILLILHRLVNSKKNRNFVYLILAYVFLGYMSGHYFLMMTIVTAVFIIFYYAGIKKKLPDRRFIAKFILSFFIILLAVMPVFYPYFSVQNETGYSRSYHMISFFSPTISDYLAFSPLITKIVGIPYTIEKVLYSGFTIVILLIWSMYYLVKNRLQDQKTMYIMMLYLLIGVICLLLSFGVLIKFSSGDGGIVGPYAILHKLVPGFDGLRALGRFFVIVLLSMSVMIGLGLKQILKKIGKKSLYIGVVIIISSLIMLEYLWVPLFQPVPYREALVEEKVPEVYHWLSDLEGDPVILELPLSENSIKPSEYIYLSSYHWQKMWNGYSGFYPEDYIRLYERIMNNFSDPETQDAISNIGVDYVVIHFDVQSEFIMNTSPEELDLLPNLELIEQFGNDYVYEIN
jgi:hypothetical protein